MPSATERLENLLRPSSSGPTKVGLDTNCIEYYLNGKKPFDDCLEPIFQAADAGTCELFVSTVVVSELLSHHRFETRQRAGYDPELALLATLDRHFDMVPVCENVAKTAGRIRADYIPGGKITLETADALIGATSLTHGHLLFVTNDHQLAKALPPGNCLYLRDIVVEWPARHFPNQCLAAVPVIHPQAGSDGLPAIPDLTKLDTGSAKPIANAKLECILYDGLRLATALNQPCVLFVLSSRQATGLVVNEILLWHDGAGTAFPPDRIMKRVRDHLRIVYDRTTGAITCDPDRELQVLSLVSYAREAARQNAFATKSDTDRLADTWNAYLAPFRTFRQLLAMPQTTWLLCENGTAKQLKPSETKTFVDQVATALGWRDNQ
jgi:predicted nucleic acid-binding protein